MTKQLLNIRVARVSTVPFSILTYLGTYLEAVSQAGAQITVVTSDDEYSKHLEPSSSYEFKPIYIPRGINIFSDLIALLKLWRLFSNQQFDIVHSTTPKAGLLCAIVSRMAGVPVRLHTFTGQPWVSLSGFKRALVKFFDKLIVRLNNQCYTDSFSQRDFLVNNKIAAQGQLKVMGSGSLAGIDLQRFTQEKFSESEKNAIRQSLNIETGSRIILFVGRITQDKGIHELLAAFKNILSLRSDVVLLVVGPFECGLEHYLRASVGAWGENKVIFTGFSPTPERFMAIADILCIPSYREGFGTVVIEAAAMGVPTIGTQIYGLSDAVVDGVTGLLVKPKNVEELTFAMQKLLKDKPLRAELGANAKQRAITDFDSKKLGELLVKEYKDLLG